MLAWAMAAQPALDKVPVAVADKFVPAEPEGQRLWGPLGDRLKANLQQLLQVDEAALLAPFEKRPAAEARSGEAVGRFLEAAARTYRYQKEQKLRVLMERVAKRLLASQLPDGYLGTSADAQRWTGWDVSTHQSNLAGLLAYWRSSGDDRALAAARRIGELLTATFAPDKRDIIAASAQGGFAGTSALQSICQLYRATGDARFLKFALYLVSAWEQASGPQLIGSLLGAGREGASTPELLRNLIGMLELYRLTADEKLLRAAIAAQQDLAGSASTGAWVEFNWHLLRLTGDPHYAAQIQKTELVEAHDVALLPQMVAGVLAGGVAIQLYEPGTFKIPAAKPLRFEVSHSKTAEDAPVVRVTLVEGEGRFPLWLRVPEGAAGFTVHVGGRKYASRPGRYLMIDRQWTTGDTAEWAR